MKVYIKKVMLKDRDLRARLNAMDAKLDRVLEKIEMAAQKQTEQGDAIVALIKGFDVELDRLADLFDALNTRLLTATDAQDRQNIHDEIARITERMKLIGKDTTNPIPPE